jgi:hypothetical protein
VDGVAGRHGAGGRIWRSTRLGVRLSPAEADAAAEFLNAAGLAMASALAGKPEAPPTSIPFGHAESHGVYADDQEPVSAAVTSLIGKVTGALITRIAADVHRYRATPPTIANTDGDPMCLITATIAVQDGVVGKLAARRDFDLDTDEPDRLTWWGAPIPDEQRKAMMAEAIAQLRAQGHKDVEAHEGPQRWVRGVLRVRDREITVEVNSEQRLTRLLDILRKVGADPVVTAEKRIDPALDFAWAAGQRASKGGAAAAAEGWEKFWLDEKVPALFGRTPRQAARGRERPYLEAMLRQFEYEADLLAAHGKTGVDTAWLREQLHMPNYLAYRTFGLSGRSSWPRLRRPGRAVAPPTPPFRQSRKAQQAQRSIWGTPVRPGRTPRISAKPPPLNSAR